MPMPIHTCARTRRFTCKIVVIELFVVWQRPFDDGHQIDGWSIPMKMRKSHLLSAPMEISHRNFPIFSLCYEWDTFTNLPFGN